MGRLFETELSGRYYCCRACFTHLALLDDLVSKGFQSRKGKAYLFKNVVNVTVGVLENKIMLTGQHTVADIYCNKCHRVLGWKYEKAYNKSQKYKEGKFVLERYKVMQGDGSDFLDHSEVFLNDLNNAYQSDENSMEG